MSKKFIILIHKYNDIGTVVKSKIDLAEILDVSLSTVMRRYKESGHYESDLYDIYIDSELYQTKRKMGYNRDVKPPVVSKSRHKDTSNHIKMTKKDDSFIRFKQDSLDTSNNDRHNNSIEVVNMETNDEVVIQPNDDWRTIESLLPMSDYDSYYSKRTYKQLTDSAQYFARDSHRLRYIKKYGALREAEEAQDSYDDNPW